MIRSTSGRRPVALALLAALAAAAPAVPSASAQDAPAAVAPTRFAAPLAGATPADAGKKADIYDPKADARATIASAVAKARRDDRRVLVMFGGNWCGWCHKLHATLKADPGLRRTMLYEYELAMVDTAAPNAEAVMADYKVDRNAGVPYLVVLDGEGKVACRQETSSLEEGDHHDPKKVAAFLEANAAKPAAADALLDEALKRAASQDKLVFLHFGAPWCGWCHELENFLARDDMAAIFGKDFVDRKIDVDRMPGGKALQEKFKAEGKGIPWFAFLDRDGKVVADSDAAGGNIGYPAEPHEIAHFVAMLKKAARAITPEQVAAIEAELKEARPRIRAGR